MYPTILSPNTTNLALGDSGHFCDIFYDRQSKKGWRKIICHKKTLKYIPGKLQI
jgi:hypothetical protein